VTDFTTIVVSHFQTALSGLFSLPLTIDGAKNQLVMAIRCNPFSFKKKTFSLASPNIPFFLQPVHQSFLQPARPAGMGTYISGFNYGNRVHAEV